MVPHEGRAAIVVTEQHVVNCIGKAAMTLKVHSRKKKNIIKYNIKDTNRAN